LSELKDKRIIVFCLLLGAFLNAQTIIYYNTPNQLFSDLDLFFTGGHTVFGEPIITNYLSFTGKAGILDGVLDSYPQHLGFENISFSRKPDFILDSGSFYKQFFSNTTLILTMNSTPRISVFSVD
jgi:hypothetical protein